MIEEEKTCVTCGETFTIHAVQQRQKKYCGYKCSVKPYKKTGNKPGPRKKK
jgi:DNA-directed RNA polymerase subunit RPC12/RpoP|tara:strand:- start:1 stop:153 length:153 start_codon:yes stop_codon:yes gene_type:complete